MSPQDDAQLSDEERDELIRLFESKGSYTFTIGQDEILFQALNEYTAKYRIFTYTDVDRGAGTITITKRPLGSLEMG